MSEKKYMNDYKRWLAFSDLDTELRSELLSINGDDKAITERFAKELDRCVRAENSDYDAKRTSDIFLAPLEVVAARHGLFDDWLLATSGRLGGQKKIPRLQNDRKIIEQMLTMNKG